MKRIKFLMLAVSSLLAWGVQAQTITLPYAMGFEPSGFDQTELSNWVLNPGTQGPSCGDKWYVGRGIHESGSQAMYITNDTATAQYGKRPCTVYAYRDILLPNGTYDISFDWYCEGSSSSYMAMGYCLTSTALNSNSNSGSIPSTLSSWLQLRTTYPTGMFGLSENKWRNESLQFTSNGTRAYRIFFIWVNNNTDPNAQTVGGCVDNIQITSANCKRPYEIAANAISCDSVVVSWKGSSSEYELQYRETGSNFWHKELGISGGITASTMLTGLQENTYDIRVRGICTPDTSAWTYLSGYIVFCPEQHCINYVDLNDPSCTCYFGSGYDGYASDKNCAYQNIGVIDYGPDSKNSRHTVNWDKTATDPRTNGQLLLVPQQEFASVRLGNWETGAEAEAISYDYHVDSTSAILLMRYAVVLEDPAHTADEQPRFVLDILDANGQLIDPTCGHCDFAANSSAAGWQTVGSGYDAVTFKPWTLLGLNLENYAGQDIKIRLTTYDCSQSGHYGYAYFTLGCASATIQTTSCAADPTVQMSLTAPEGFDYQWYYYNGSPVPVNQGGKSRTLEVAASDTTTYKCTLTSRENPACKFDLHSQCMPQEPVSEFKYTYTGHDCTNEIQLEATSFIRTTYNNDTVDHRDRKCEEFEWLVENPATQWSKTGNKPNQTILLPNAGGTFNITLTSIVSGSCADDTTIVVTVPAIRDYEFNLDTTLCQGQVVQFGDQVIGSTGMHRIELKTIAGCDSIINMNVTINPTYEQRLDTVTICQGDSFCVDGDCYSKTKSGMFIRRLQTVQGCDSALMQYVIVKDSIQPIILQDSIDLEAGKYTADLHINGTGFDRVVIEGDTLTKEEGELFISELGLGIYDIEFLNDFDCSYHVTEIVGGACLSVTLQNQIRCQGGTPVIIYPFTVDTGMVTTYSLLFSQAAQAAGFQDVTGMEPTRDADGEYSISVQIPNPSEPGVYPAKLVLEDKVCGDDTINLMMMLTYPASVMFHRWDDVISLKNATAAGYGDGTVHNYNFVAYQWLLNGDSIFLDEDHEEPANLSYYHNPNGLSMDGEYQLILTRVDSLTHDTITFVTCAYVPNAQTAIDENVCIDATVVPTLLRPSETLYVRISTAGTATLYTTTGQMVKTAELKEGTNTLTAPDAKGIYIMTVRTREGQKTHKISVQ